MSERAALAERIGKEAVARYSYIHPSAITMGADTGVDGETWGDIVRDIGNLALAAVEAAGWGPRPGIGFAVVRTADVEAARDCARGMALECRGKPKDDYNALADRLEEAIR